MALYLLDTNIVSFIIKKASLALISRVRALPAGSFAISTITEAEIRLGLELAPPEAKFRPLAEEYLREVEIELWDSQSAAQYAFTAARQQRIGKPLAPLDTMIAAHALSRNQTLVTNDRAFRHIKGLKIEDWTKGPQRA